VCLFLLRNFLIWPLHLLFLRRVDLSSPADLILIGVAPLLSFAATLSFLFSYVSGGVGRQAVDESLLALLSKTVALPRFFFSLC